MKKEKKVKKNMANMGNNFHQFAPFMDGPKQGAKYVFHFQVIDSLSCFAQHCHVPPTLVKHK